MTTNPYLTKSKSGKKVKPIIRKLTQSERSSLDLMREDGYDALGIDYGSGTRSASDVAFNRTHRRATSNTSHLSTNTTGSTHRAPFVHPFGQRPYTPPSHSYQGSAIGSEYSSALHEDEEMRHTTSNNNTRSVSNLSNYTPSMTGSATMSPPLRIQTTLSSSRLAQRSNSDLLHSPRTMNSLDLGPSGDNTLYPVSALRSSMDKGFRIRSRSELDTFDRAEAVRRARREFVEKENQKNEKAAREELRAQEKKREREERGLRKSMASDRSRTKRSMSNPLQEKDAFTEENDSNDPTDGLYTSTTPERPQPQRQTTSTKRRTQSAWMRFMMWLRTRFLRLEKRASRS